MLQEFFQTNLHIGPARESVTVIPPIAERSIRWATRIHIPASRRQLDAGVSDEFP